MTFASVFQISRPNLLYLGTHLAWCLKCDSGSSMVVAAFNHEKTLVGAFSVITDLRLYLRFKLYYHDNHHYQLNIIYYLLSNIFYPVSRSSVSKLCSPFLDTSSSSGRHSSASSSDMEYQHHHHHQQQQQQHHNNVTRCTCRSVRCGAGGSRYKGAVRFGRFSHGEIRFSVKTLKLTIVGTCTSF